MITVKLFGLVSIEANITRIFVNEGTVRDVLNQVKEKYPSFTEQKIKQTIMFINNKQVSGSKRFSLVLKDGDELALLSPLCGG